MDKLGEANWLNKRIEEYEHLVRSGEMPKEEAEQKMNFLELRLEQIDSMQAALS